MRGVYASKAVRLCAVDPGGHGDGEDPRSRSRSRPGAIREADARHGRGLLAASPTIGLGRSPLCAPRVSASSALPTSKVLFCRKDSGAKSLCAREMKRPRRGRHERHVEADSRSGLPHESLLRSSRASPLLRPPCPRCPQWFLSSSSFASAVLRLCVLGALRVLCVSRSRVRKGGATTWIAGVASAVFSALRV